MDDLISRSSAIEQIERREKLMTGDKRVGVEHFKTFLMNRPTIDAEPVRHGRWILKVHDEGINYRWNVTAYCSECCDEESEIWAGFFPGVPDFMARDIALDSAKTVKLSNYCPNCGAKMDLEVQEWQQYRRTQT